VELLPVEKQLQVFVGGLRVAEMNLNRLAAAGQFADCQRLLAVVHAQYIPDNEIATPEPLLPCIDRAADEQSA